MIDNLGVRQTMAVGASRYDEALGELGGYRRGGPTETGQVLGQGGVAVDLVLERGYLLGADALEELS